MPLSVSVKSVRSPIVNDGVETEDELPAALAAVPFTVSAPPAGAVTSRTSVNDAAAPSPVPFVAVTVCAPAPVAAAQV